MPILISISKERWAWQLGIVGAMVSPKQQRSLLVPSGIAVLRCIYHIYGVTASLPWIASTWVVSRPQVMCSLLPRHSHDLARHCLNLCVLIGHRGFSYVFLFSGQSAWAHWTKRWVQGQWDWAIGLCSVVAGYASKASLVLLAPYWNRPSLRILGSLGPPRCLADLDEALVAKCGCTQGASANRAGHAQVGQQK